MSVSLEKGMYRARVFVDGKRITVGRYDTARKAHNAIKRFKLAELELNNTPLPHDEPSIKLRTPVTELQHVPLLQPDHILDPTLFPAKQTTLEKLKVLWQTIKQRS